MSQGIALESTMTALPRTRSLRRARPWRAWWLAVGLALGANLAVVLALSQVSRLAPAAPPPPLATRRLARLPEPPTPPPLPVAPAAPAETLPTEAVPLALPSLDLPDSGPPGALALPALGRLDADLALPLVVPAFAPIGAPGDGAPGPAMAGALPPIDTPAERLGGFDLERFYPRAARLRGLTGSTRVRLGIGADGAVTAVTVLASQPEGVFEAAAERLARSLRYRPALRAGAPVPSEVETVITWTLQ